MLKILPTILFPNSFDFILLFLKFSPIIPKIIPHQVKPKPEKISTLFYSTHIIVPLNQFITYNKERFLPTGGGLQWTLRFLAKSDGLGACNLSNKLGICDVVVSDSEHIVVLEACNCASSQSN